MGEEGASHLSSAQTSGDQVSPAQDTPSSYPFAVIKCPGDALWPEGPVPALTELGAQGECLEVVGAEPPLVGSLPGQGPRLAAVESGCPGVGEKAGSSDLGAEMSLNQRGTLERPSSAGESQLLGVTGGEWEAASWGAPPPEPCGKDEWGIPDAAGSCMGAVFCPILNKRPCFGKGSDGGWGLQEWGERKLSCPYSQGQCDLMEKENALVYQCVHVNTGCCQKAVGN